MSDFLIPPGEEEELGLVWAMILNPSVVPRVLENLSPDDFAHPIARAAVRAIMNIDNLGKPLDTYSLAAEMRRDGSTMSIAEIWSYGDVPPLTSHSLGRAIESTIGRARIRRIAEAASSVVTEARLDPPDSQGFADRAEGLMLEATRSDRTKNDIVDARGEMTETVVEIENACKQGEIVGLTTGLADLDRVTQGLQRSDLIIIAARPGMGKSALALNIASHCACNCGQNVLFFSLEMPQRQLHQRMLGSMGRVNTRNIRGGMVTEDEWPRLCEASQAISNSPGSLLICDTGALNIFDIRSRARRAHARHGLSLIVVDYLQLARGRSRNPETRDIEVGQVTGGLKALAKELDIPIIALSQLNRGLESRADKRPQLADLRESGNIEQDADLVCFIYRDEVYNEKTPDRGVAELIIRKHRNGECGTVKLRWFAEFTKFSNLERREGRM